MLRVLKNIIEVCDPIRLFVFGSVARGTANADSDVDLFLVVDDTADIEALYSRLDELGVGRSNDIVIRRLSEFERNKMEIGKIDVVVDIEGKLIYERE